MPTLSKLTKTAFHSEAAAFEYLEATLWPSWGCLPALWHRRQRDQASDEGRRPKRQAAGRTGLWKCKEKECRKQFTVKVGTVFEHGRIPLHKMLQAVYLLCCSKKGISSHQLHRVLGITYKAAWFLSLPHPEAMAGRFSYAYWAALARSWRSTKPHQAGKQGAPRHLSSRTYGGWSHRNIVLTLVQRGGPVRVVFTLTAPPSTICCRSSVPT